MIGRRSAWGWESKVITVGFLRRVTNFHVIFDAAIPRSTQQLRPPAIALLAPGLIAWFALVVALLLAAQDWPTVTLRNQCHSDGSNRNNHTNKPAKQPRPRSVAVLNYDLLFAWIGPAFPSIQQSPLPFISVKKKTPHFLVRRITSEIPVTDLDAKSSESRALKRDKPHVKS